MKGFLPKSKSPRLAQAFACVSRSFKRPKDDAGDNFGENMTISGNIIIAGYSQADDYGISSDSVYIFAFKTGAGRSPKNLPRAVLEQMIIQAQCSNYG